MRAAPSHAVLGLLCLLTVFPMLWAVLTSLKPVNEIFTLDLISSNATLDNYAEVYRAVPFLRMMLNTLIVATVMTLLTLALSIAVAYALTRWDFPGKRLVYLAFAGSLLFTPKPMVGTIV